MLIDWFTVAAQALNFLILVWLLQHFLYQPVLDAIDAREARIAQQITQAQTAQREAQVQRDTLAQQTATLERERASLLAQARQAAHTEHARLLETAHRDARALSAQQQLALQAQASSLGHELRERAQREVFAIARQALNELATASLEAQIIQVFITQLHALDGPTRTALASALAQPKTQAQVRSAFDLSGTQQSSIQTAVNDSLCTACTLEFTTAQSLAGGIELVAGGQKIAWNIAHYLDTLDHLATDIVQAQAKTQETNVAPGASAITAATPTAENTPASPAPASAAA